jgi:hypothetical protein
MRGQTLTVSKKNVMARLEAIPESDARWADFSAWISPWVAPTAPVQSRTPAEAKAVEEGWDSLRKDGTRSNKAVDEFLKADFLELYENIVD